MKKKILTLIILPLYLFSELSLAETSNSKLQARKASLGAVCAALISATTGVAIVAKAVVTHTVDFGPNDPLYRNRNALYLMLKRAILRRKIKLENGEGQEDVVIMAEYELPKEVNINFASIYDNLSEQQLDHQIVYHGGRQGAFHSGFILLPGMTAYFEITVEDEAQWKFVVKDYVSGYKLFEGLMAPKNVIAALKVNNIAANEALNTPEDQPALLPPSK